MEKFITNFVSIHILWLGWWLLMDNFYFKIFPPSDDLNPKIDTISYIGNLQLGIVIILFLYFLVFEFLKTKNPSPKNFFYFCKIFALTFAKIIFAILVAWIFWYLWIDFFWNSAPLLWIFWWYFLFWTMIFVLFFKK